jgi:hypothetical protein
MARIVEAIGRWRSGALSCEQAAEVLGMSERHFRRLRDRYEAEGAEGVIDRRRGRVCADPRPPRRADRRQGLSQPRRPEGPRRRPVAEPDCRAQAQGDPAWRGDLDVAARCTATGRGCVRGSAKRPWRCGRRKWSAASRPRSQRPAPDPCARSGERPKALARPRRGLQPRPGDAAIDRRRHAEGTGRPRRPAPVAARPRSRPAADPHPSTKPRPAPTSSTGC